MCEIYVTKPQAINVSWCLGLLASRPPSGLLTITPNLPSIAEVIRPRRSSTLGTALVFAATAASVSAARPTGAANAPSPTSPPPSSAAGATTPPPSPTPPPISAPAATAAAGTAPATAKLAPPPAGSPSSSPGAPASGSRFGVVGIGPASLPPTLATQLDAAAAAGLTASGATVVGRELTARPAGSCDGPTCLQQVARASGAQYLLRGTCVIEGSTYRVHLDLVDGSTGTVALSRQDTCEICTEHDVVEATNIAASALKATFDRTPRPSAVSASSARTIAYPPPAGVDLRAGQDHADQGPPLWLRVAPWVAFAAAAGAIGTGVYYLSRSGQTSCGKFADEATGCTRLYSTGLQGGLWLGAGAVAGALGVLALTLTPSSPPGSGASRASNEPRRAPLRPPVGLTLSPAGVSAWTRF